MDVLLHHCIQGDYNSKEHEMEMREDGDYEKEFSQELVKEELIHDNQEVEVKTS